MWHPPPGGGGGGFTTPPMVTAIVVLAVRAAPAALVPLPEIVRVNIPAAAVPADTVTTLLLVAGLVANVTVAPAGTPDALNVTGPLNPPMSVMLTVSVAVPLAAMDRDAAEGAKVNEGGGGGGGFPLPPPSGNCMAARIACFCGLGGVAL